jgi:hypothetical protein
MVGVHRRCGAADVGLKRIAVGKELVGEQVRVGHADIFEFQSEVLGAIVCEDGLGCLA